MIKRLISQYLPGYPETLVYMLQSTEYQVAPYLAWYQRLPHFFGVAKRRSLNRTKAAKLLMLGLVGGMLVQLLLGIYLAVDGANLLLNLVGVLLIVTYPQAWARLVVVPLWLGRILIIYPKYKKRIAAAEKIFADHKAQKIAIIGSYGKTTFKELLLTVLSEGKKVAATPANKNVAISHARFAEKLSGEEEVLIIEYGEEKPGDILAFARSTHPDLAVITGVAPAHLDHYGSVDAAAKDIFSINHFLDETKIYVNSETETIKPYLKPGFHEFNSHEAWGWKVSDVKVDVSHTSFVISKGDKKMKLQSGLLGIHQVGPLAAVAALADQLGLSVREIEAGIEKTKPFDHRMQPRALRGGWIIDDTYNGNIEGMRAGLKLLTQLSGKRKTYITPGLVDQGEETVPVHLALGQAIAEANPDKVILMQNSATEHIQKGLQEAGYSGEIKIEEDPLTFYTNIEHFIAAGDIVLMQNDWTDNYN